MEQKSPSWHNIAPHGKKNIKKASLNTLHCVGWLLISLFFVEVYVSPHAGIRNLRRMFRRGVSKFQWNLLQQMPSRYCMASHTQANREMSVTYCQSNSCLHLLLLLLRAMFYSAEKKEASSLNCPFKFFVWKLDCFFTCSCFPGFWRAADCRGAGLRTDCKPCPKGYYMENMNYHSKCLECKKCKGKVTLLFALKSGKSLWFASVVYDNRFSCSCLLCFRLSTTLDHDQQFSACTPTTNTICGCKQGSYKVRIDSIQYQCEKCKQCGSGEREIEKCKLWKSDKAIHATNSVLCLSEKIMFIASVAHQVSSVQPELNYCFL